MVQRLQQGAAVPESTQAVQAHGVEALEYVAILTMLRRTPVLLGEALDFLEARDDALLTGRPSGLRLGRCELGKLRSEFVKIGVTHSAPPP